MSETPRTLFETIDAVKAAGYRLDMFHGSPVCYGKPALTGELLDDLKRHREALIVMLQKKRMPIQPWPRDRRCRRCREIFPSKRPGHRYCSAICRAEAMDGNYC